MAYDIVIGRNSSDKEKFKEKGLTYIGKGFVKMGNYTSLSNNIWMDIVRSHVILVAGKRGSGKSYTLSTIAEELTDLQDESSKNIASLMFDTMGIFWTMKYKNEKDAKLLKDWNLKPKNLPVVTFAPIGKISEYKEKGIPIDYPFALQVSELKAEDWLSIFNLKLNDPVSVLIIRTLEKISQIKNFKIQNIQEEIEKDEKSDQQTKQIAFSLFSAAEGWGIFSKDGKGTEINDLINAGKTTILDISTYSSVSIFNIRALLISLISRKLFNKRMDSRKKEELESIQQGQNYLSSKQKKQDPLVWIFIDEAHEFLPRLGKTPATDALVQILREGRQPGISLVLATQQPGQIHKDVMTQSDIVIAHRVTAKPDIEALNTIMQTYLLDSIKKQMDNLPSLKGSAIILDDNSERIYPIRIRPKFTWHGGEAPTAVKAEQEI